MEIKGKVHEILAVQQVSDTFKKREIVIEFIENPQYPDFIQFEVTQDKCAMLDNFKVGEHVEVFFNIRGRAWTNKEGQKKYFNSLQAWRINKITAGAPSSNSAPQEFVPPTSLSTDNSTNDDLPF